MLRRACLYLRQSKSHPEGIDRQRERCVKLAELRGWQVVATFQDDDVSASKQRGAQTGWGRMLAAAERGEFDVIIAVDLDRLLRTITDLAVLIEAGVPVVTVDGEIDLTTADGEFRGTMLTAMARFEVRRKSERQRRAYDHRAASLGMPGRPGGIRPYGWNEDRVTLRPAEASIVQETTARVIAGDSLIGICRDLNARGIPTTKGGTWTPVQLKAMLTRERNCGRLVHRGEVMPTSTIEPAVAVEDFELVKGLLAQRAQPGRKPEKRWLTGLLTCECGTAMVSKSVSDKQGRHASYMCRSKVIRAQQTEGQHVTIRAEVAEQKALLSLYGAFSAGVYEAADEPAEGRLRAVQQELASLGEQRAAATDALMEPGIDKGRVRARLAQISEAIEKAEQERTSLLSASSGTDVRAILATLGDSGETAEAWLDWFQALDVERRRDIFKATYRGRVVKGGKGAKRLVLEPRA